jgi:Fe-Mn family superoxide dismutase
MPFTLPDLPYAFDALEPNIDARTMEIHHGKHHAGYTTKLNAAVEGTDMAGMAIEDILRRGADALPGAVRNNGGGYANHNLFWQVMAPGGNKDASDEIKAAIDAELGGHAGFKPAFSDAAATRFGSGWAWLVVKGDGSLAVYSTANQDSPYMQGDTPILGLDVWEHAYYLNYQNRRPDYIEAFFNVVNWAKVSELYAAATGG